MRRWGLLVLLAAGRVGAQEDAGARFETTVSSAPAEVPSERAASEVRQGDLERRLPRSAPDALRFEPGVFIQQTAHGQASAYLRGLTGQQTVLLFDGVRLNTSTWRQGPNQYFFTLDAATVDAIEVLRGGASTRFGSDALGGVISATPLEAPVADGRFRLSPVLTLKGTTADSEAGGRVSVSGTAGPVGFIGGVGLRRVGLLQSAGTVRSPLDGRPPDVPRFAPDGRTQLGTGFNELTADGRFTVHPSASHELTLASQAYRQFDAPRTDQCPPAFARSDECLTYKEQFRTLTWASWKARLGVDVETLKLTASWQRQHEVREGARPASFVLNTGRDVVDTFGAAFTLGSRSFLVSDAVQWSLQAGLDSYLDLVDSQAFVSFTDIAVTRQQSRGQYVAGSRSLTGGLFADATLRLGARLTVRAGGRVGWASLSSPGDAASQSQPIAASWAPLAGHLGVEWAVASPLSLLVNVDRSFRAPNLDDLTSRQQTGPGFQFENPALRPETALTAELGARLRLDWLSLEGWGFQTWLDGAMLKQPRDVAECPPSSAACGASWFRYQLVNAVGLSEVRGVEGSVRARLPSGFGARATAAYTWGQGPAQVPLSRIPPANGHLELSWRHDFGFTGAAVLRWAGPQTRLALADLSDARIPLGGTPGYAVVDLRASLRVSAVVLSLVLENLFDSPWRAHGSSINGAGRGVMFLATFRPPSP